ncbi:S41 family peptidase [Marinoscillum sp. MHG1-6]|uniref:S41 family peptidase n=1 Tax=Marinoscillum sp. MHG1-6 TaxID=2959627 RepID=UPI002157FCCF|nr:S41 family peptidase [Marinoscillum sp. MHG1-6]
MKHSVLILFLSISISFVSCKKENDKISATEVNEWIYSEMTDWYYWTDFLPSDPDYALSAPAFYNALLYEADRFSFYYEDYETLINLLNGVSLESGFEYQLYKDSDNPGKVYGVILYIKQGSPADQAGLKRGDLFRQVNGTDITESNFSSIREAMSAPYTLSYERYNFQNQTFDKQPDLDLTPIQFAENPFLLDTILDISGNKVGYLVYTFFSPGATETSSEYTDQMDQIFQNYQAAGLSHIIVDLRFNSGGSERSIRNLASYLVPSAYTERFVMKKQYNQEVQDYILNEPSLGTDYLQIQFSNKSANIGDQVSGNGITFITADHTASASEALMNSLKPFQTIHVVGDTTVGKDVGSITIYDENHSNNRIGLQPIIVKIVNDLEEDYPNGFTPEVPIEDRFKVLYPLGSMDEPLLQAAIDNIFGVSARQAKFEMSTDQPLRSSIPNRSLKVLSP